MVQRVGKVGYNPSVSPFEKGGLIEGTSKGCNPLRNKMEEKEIRRRLKKGIEPPDTIKKDIIEIVDYKYRNKRDVEIIIENKEFTSVCPRTGLPDFGKITIKYVPRRKIIELKSLKFYFLQYRNVGIFYEHIVNKILEDLISLVKPKWMEVIGEFNIRGGIKTATKAEYRK